MRATSLVPGMRKQECHAGAPASQLTLCDRSIGIAAQVIHTMDLTRTQPAAQCRGDEREQRADEGDLPRHGRVMRGGVGGGFHLARRSLDLGRNSRQRRGGIGLRRAALRRQQRAGSIFMPGDQGGGDRGGRRLFLPSAVIDRAIWASNATTAAGAPDWAAAWDSPRGSAVLPSRVWRQGEWQRLVRAGAAGIQHRVIRCAGLDRGIRVRFPFRGGSGRTT